MKRILKITILLVISLLLCSFVHASSVTYDGNYALSFDGSNDFVAIQPTYNDDTLDDIWTLEAWIYPTAEQQYWQLNIVGFAGRHPNLEYCGQSNWQCPKGAPLTQLREADGSYYVVVGDPDKLAPDQWHHVAGSWDNATLSLYVDGVLDASINPYEKNYTEGHGCTGFDCDVGIQIGGYRLRTPTGYFSSQYFQGYIDEVRVWKIGRTQQEIVKTMSTTVSGGEPGLLYYWRFDEGRGTTIKSLAVDAYGLLGAGNMDAEPRFVKSTAPIKAGSDDVGERDTIVIEKNSPFAVAAGALVGLFFMCGGMCIGFIIGWKIHEKRIPLRFLWESDGLLNPPKRRDSFDEHMEMRDNRGTVSTAPAPSASSLASISSALSGPSSSDAEPNSGPTSNPGPSKSNKGKGRATEQDREAMEEGEAEGDNLLS